MASIKHALMEHDTVVLGEPVGPWPAGTVGAVVSVYDDAVLVEIVGPSGETLDTVAVPSDLAHIRKP